MSDENKEDSPDVSEADGLSADDVIALATLVRAQTDEKILCIESQECGAEVRTGVLFSPDAGEGKCFTCERTNSGWQVVSVNQWIV